MQVISSKDNEMIRQIKKLKEKKYRNMQNQFIIEGIKIIEEAIQENAKIDKIVVCEECVKDGTIGQKLLYEIAKYQCIYVTQKIFESISDVTNPQGILAVIQKQESELRIDYSDDMIVILDDIQDPGNLGTIIRTLDSANLKQVIVSKDTTDCYNPKVVRSTMGAIFRVKVIVQEDWEELKRKLKREKFEILATSLENDASIYDISYQKKAIVIGNEANGVSEEWIKLADKKVKIPMLGKTESLNASVATSIIVYEYVRQKIKRKV